MSKYNNRPNKVCNKINNNNNEEEIIAVELRHKKSQKINFWIEENEKKENKYKVGLDDSYNTIIEEEDYELVY